MAKQACLLSKDPTVEDRPSLEKCLELFTPERIQFQAVIILPK